ncbi:hypothetical protein F0160_22715 [Paraburkholderia sp. JPY303]|uniref:hypothetical protein n=1 Tax=Paraburkholderia atlantica TaxID=2654982 RepID=UPI001590DF95|nr:hypothetical protein [Paraburkholderia atlantica]NUY33301.1 hypothetical protein [Paraburkholderia atlantica]
MNNYPYFGFQTPAMMQQAQMQQNPMMNPATSYQGAMPAGMFGFGAMPNGTVQQDASMNPQMMGSLANMGSGLLAQSQNHNQPANVGAAMAPAAMNLMMKNPQLMQQGAQGLMGLFGAGS